MTLYHKSHLTFLVLIVFALLVMTAPANAQSTVKFDPARHLAGFEEATFSEYNYLYAIDRFEALSGTTMKPGEFEEIRARWSAEKDRVAIAIDEIEKSPKLRTLHLIERQMSKHHYFSRISYTKVLDYEPVVLFVQDLQKPDPRFAKMVVDRYGPPLAKMVETFNSHYAERLDLRLRDGHAAFVLVVLSSYGDYKNYIESASHRGTFTNGAYYDHDLRAAVVYENAFDRTKSPEGPCRRAALFTMALNVLHAHRAYDDLPLWGGWIYVGIAENLSRFAQYGHEFVPGRFESKALRDLGAMVKDPVDRRAFYLHPAEIIASRSQDEIYQIMEPRSAALKKNRSGWWARGIAYSQKQSGLLVHFLENGLDGKYSIPFLKRLEEIMAVNQPPPKETKKFAAVDVTVIAEEYLDFFGAQLKTRAPDLALNKTTRRALTESRSAGGAGNRSAPPSSPYAGSKVIKEDFDPASLRSADLSADDAFRVALYEARCGKIDGALLEVRNLRAARLKKGAIAELARREQKRLEALSALRGAFLDGMLESKKKIRVDYGDGKISGTLLKFDEETFCVDAGRRGEITIPMAVLDPVVLAKQVRDKKLALCDEWVLGYAYLLGGNKLWKKYSRGADLQAAALVEDAVLIEKCLARGETLALLGGLAQSPLPESAERAQATIALIETLLDEHGAAEAVQRQRGNLKLFAAFCYARIFDSLPLDEVTTFLQGETEVLDGGKVRITYPFDSAAELFDFEEVEYLDEIREVLAPLKTSREESYMKIHKGALRCRGQMCRRFKVDLEAPLKISYPVVFDSRGVADENLSGWFFVGCCEDGYGSGIRCINVGDLEVCDKKSNIQKSNFRDDPYCQPNVPYKIEMVHDGEELQTFVDSDVGRALPVGRLQQGGIYLWINYDVAVIVKELVIEGTPGPRFQGTLRDQWVAERLAALDL